eukprot:TRINITY_DN25131_c0_g1_i1.p1 TRINITY_DN25131_c0_g1~~TRINITY_DN25131_c0_g1_i1.p1  ORF type:complete len:522 (+),score=39.14 TRINITY_DN25131_c0_g1_i1:236-1801(+)
MTSNFPNGSPMLEQNGTLTALLQEWGVSQEEWSLLPAHVKKAKVAEKRQHLLAQQIQHPNNAILSSHDHNSSMSELDRRKSLRIATRSGRDDTDIAILDHPAFVEKLGADTVSTTTPTAIRRASKIVKSERKKSQHDARMRSSSHLLRRDTRNRQWEVEKLFSLKLSPEKEIEDIKREIQKAGSAFHPYTPISPRQETNSAPPPQTQISGLGADSTDSCRIGAIASTGRMAPYVDLAQALIREHESLNGHAAQRYTSLCYDYSSDGNDLAFVVQTKRKRHRFAVTEDSAEGCELAFQDAVAYRASASLHHLATQSPLMVHRPRLSRSKTAPNTSSTPSTKEKTSVVAPEGLIPKEQVSAWANKMIDDFRESEGLLGPAGQRIKGFQVNYTEKYRCFAVYWQQRGNGRKSKFFYPKFFTVPDIREALLEALEFRDRCRAEGSLPTTFPRTHYFIKGSCERPPTHSSASDSTAPSTLSLSLLPSVPAPVKDTYCPSPNPPLAHKDVDTTSIKSSTFRANDPIL